MAQIYLIGFMGTGKSSVARALATRMELPCRDMDEEIIRKTGMSVSDYFEEKGEEAFRDVEHEVLEELSRKEDAVISCGGGAVLRMDNLECMHREGTTFLLTATPETVLQRVKHDNRRPLLKGKKNVEAIAALMEERVPFYEKAADYHVQTDEKTPAEIAEKIQSILENKSRNEN